ncbi:MAG: hypothetical protein K6G73_08765 [Marinilabiliaceae bacterium]|jgi:hypothetical protein|nr:hypothetical protein [Marinilabiliaceae bacterium]
MKRIVLLTIVHLVIIQCANTQGVEFHKSYFSLVENRKFTFELCSITDTLDIAYLSKGYNAEREKGGSGFLILLPRDTTYSKITNFNRFSPKQWKKRGELVLSQEKMLIDGILKEDVEEHFEIYFFYFEQESLYAEGSFVDDNGVEWPDWGPKDNAPLEVYKWENDKWEFQYIQQRTTRSAQSYGMEKAEKILKERFGKIAEEMERKK